MLNNNNLQQPHDPYFDQDYKQAGGQNLKTTVPDDSAVFESLCYEVFIRNPLGKQLFEMIEDKYLDRCLFNPNHVSAPNLAMYFSGFKEAFRGIYLSAKHHEKLLKEGKR